MRKLILVFGITLIIIVIVLICVFLFKMNTSFYNETDPEAISENCIKLVGDNNCYKANEITCEQFCLKNTLEDYKFTKWEYT
ncbi:MAG: hypothetical protein WCF78_02080, partial [archaeon]